MSVSVLESATPGGDLVGRAAAGDREAFGELYDQLAPRAHDLALRITGSEADAADAVQETFTSLLRRLLRGGPENPVRDAEGYVVVTARHASLRIMSERGRSTPVEEVPEPGLGSLPGRDEPEREALAAARRDEVRDANERLPVRHREVLALRHVAGWSYDEIGRHMGLTTNAVAQLVWRARTRLRRELRIGALHSMPPRTAECETALLLISRREDGETLDPGEELWLDGHLDDCDGCRLNRAALLEVGATYGAWMPAAGAVLGVAVLRDRVLDGAWAAAHAAGAGAASGAGSAGGAGAGGAGTAGGAGAGLGAIGPIVAASVAALAIGGATLALVGHKDSGRSPAAAHSTAPGHPAAPAASRGSAHAASRAARAAATTPPVAAALRRLLKPADLRGPGKKGAKSPGASPVDKPGPRGGSPKTPGATPKPTGGSPKPSGGSPQGTPPSSPPPSSPPKGSSPPPSSPPPSSPPPSNPKPPVVSNPPPVTTPNPPPTTTPNPPPTSGGVTQGCAPALPPGQVKKGLGAPGNSGHGCRGRR